MDVHISLDEEAFNQLIKGEPADVTTPSGTTVHVLLDDIGHARMLTLVAQAMVDDPVAEMTVWIRKWGDTS